MLSKRLSAYQQVLFSDDCVVFRLLQAFGAILAHADEAKQRYLGHKAPTIHIDS